MGYIIVPISFFRRFQKKNLNGDSQKIGDIWISFLSDKMNYQSRQTKRWLSSNAIISHIIS